MMKYIDNQMIIILSCIFAIVVGQEYLQDVPITFSLNGATTYVPSTGGVAIPGYSITIGFTRYSWLGKHYIQLRSSISDLDFEQ